MNSIIKFGNANNDINIGNLLISVINLLNNSTILRSQSFDDELSNLFYNICIDLESKTFRQRNQIEFDKGFYQVYYH